MTDLFAELARHPLFSGGIALMAVGAAAAWLRRVPSMGIAAARRRLFYTVEVYDRDQCFAWFQAWLAGRDESGRARDLVVKTHWGGTSAPCAAGQPVYLAGADPEKVRLLLTPAPGIQWMRYRGRPLLVQRARREGRSGDVAVVNESITLRFFGVGRATVDAMLAEVLAFAEEKPDGVPVVTACGDGWRQGPVLPRRSPDSLTLADGLFDDVLADIRAFRSSARWYADRGVPYRRGYLLHGPPGTGKTTLAPVVAGELGLSVATMSLGDFGMCDAQLRGLFDNLGRGTILVIEDIDCAFRERKADEPRGVTLSGLLNVLDGIGSKEGRILFLTTNHPERLDPALVRPGRVDRKVELGYATPGQAARMFRWFFREHSPGEAWIDRLAGSFAGRVGADVAPAAIQEHLLRHRDDPAEAVQTFGAASRAPAPGIRPNGHVPAGVPAWEAARS